MTNLKRIREASGLSQSRLATISGVSIRNIRAYESTGEQSSRDINKAQALVVYQLAQALGCSMDELLELKFEDKVGALCREARLDHNLEIIKANLEAVQHLKERRNREIKKEVEE